MPQMVAVGPFRKLDLRYELWTQPLNLLHDLRCDRFATPSAQVDLEQGQVHGSEPIEGQGPPGTLSADRFEIRDAGDLDEPVGGAGRDRLLAFPTLRIREVLRKDSGRVAAALAVQAALATELWLFVPLRIANFAALRLDQHLIRREDKHGERPWDRLAPRDPARKGKDRPPVPSRSETPDRSQRLEG